MQKKIVLQFLSMLLVLFVAFGAAEFTYAQSPEADVFAVIKLSNPQELIPSIGQWIDKFQPGMGGLVNPMMVGNMVFKNPNWTGMDMAGDYIAVVLNPMKYPQSPYALIMPLTNNDEFIGAISQSLTGGEEVNGIYTFTQPNQNNLFVALAGDKGIFSESNDIAAQVKMLVEANSPVLSEVPVVKGQLAASLAVNKILMTVRPMLDMLKQQILMGMEQSMQSGEGGEGQQPPAAAVKNILQTEFEMMLSLLDQTEKLQLGVGLEQEGIRLSKAVFAMGGSNLAKFMAAQTPQTPPLLGVIAPDSGIIGSGSIHLTPEFINFYTSFFKAMSSVGVETDEAMTGKIVDWAKQALQVFSGDFAFGALSQANDSLVTQIFTVSDAAKAKQLIEQYPEMLQAMMTMYGAQELGLNMQLTDTSQVKGGEILNYTFGFNADMIPDPQGKEMFTKLFGEEIAFPIGFVGNYGVVGFGKNARAQVEKAIEVLDSGTEVAAKYTPAMFNLPEENNLFVYLSIPKVIAWVAKYAPEAPPIEQVESPGLGIAARFIEAHFEGELFLPAEEILAIQKIIMQAKGPMQPPAN